jgi:hypothetical protein
MTAICLPSHDPDFHRVNPANPLAEIRHADDDGECPDLLPFVLTKAETRAYRRRMVQRCPECIYCGCKITDENQTTEHALPQSMGGGNQPWNLWLSCAPCNAERSARSLPKWIAEMRRDSDKLQRKAERIELAGQRMGILPKPEHDDSLMVATSG